MPKKYKKSTRGGDFASDAYDTSASFGRLMSYFSLLIGIIVGVIFLVMGIYIIRKPALTGTAEGTIKSVSCPGNSCSGTLSFTGLDKTDHIVTIPGTYAIGQIVSIHYNPTDPSQVTTGNVSNKTTGIIVLIVGVFILIGAIIWFYIVQKYKAAAAATGALDAVNIGANMF
jgi:hypothetical protein